MRTIKSPPGKKRSAPLKRADSMGKARANQLELMRITGTGGVPVEQFLVAHSQENSLRLLQEIRDLLRKFVIKLNVADRPKCA